MASSPLRMVSGFTMSGGSFGISGPAPAWAGYLGKSQDGPGLAETCPWCEAKGQVVTLRSYAINHKESIRLCPSPMCIFPLVSRPLEAVLSSLSSTPVPDQPDQTPAAPDSPDLAPPSAKRARTEEPPAKACSVHPNGATLPDPSTQNGDCLHATAENEGLSSVRDGDGSVCEDDDSGMVCAPPEEVSAPAVGTPATGAAHKLDARASATAERSEVLSVKDPASVEEKSGSNLSWLNSLLVALAQCKTLRLSLLSSSSSLSSSRHGDCSQGRKRKNVTPDVSPVWDLCACYERASSLRQSNRQMEEGIDALQEGEKKLADLRSSVLQLLQHPLRRKLELLRRTVETPALALPALLELDSDAKELFQHSVRWESDCQACGCSSSSSCTSTVTAYTELVSDLHPLSAPVQITCSRCQSNNQKKKILQERFPSVFALHFVNGVPHNDVTACSFGYADAQYAVTVVIQHKERENLFISWSRQSDGSWTAYNDFTAPRGKSHSKLDVPEKEIHMIFWEVKSEDSHQTTTCTPVDIPSSTDSKPEEEDGVEVVPPEDVSFVSNTCTPMDIPSSTDSKPEEEDGVEVVPPEDVSFVSNTCTPVDIPSSTDSKPEEEDGVEVVPLDDKSFVSNTCTPVDIPSSTDSKPEEEDGIEVVSPEDVSFVSNTCTPVDIPSSTDSQTEEEVCVEVVPPEDVSFVSTTCTPVDIPSSTASKPEKEVCVEVSPPEDVSFMSNTCTPVDIPSSTDSKPEEEVCVEVVPPEDVSFVSTTGNPVDIPSSTDSKPEEEDGVEVVPPEDVSFVSNTCTPVDIPSSTDSQPEEEVCVEVVPPEDVSFVSPLEDTFVEALKPIDPDVSVMDTSIGSATLLDTFEGLSHNDIVTLTLEQVKVEAKAKNRKASLDPPAVGGAAEPLVAEETEPTEVSSPVIRRSSRIAIKQIERKVKQNSRRNNIREGENPEPQALKTPEKLKTTPQRKKAQSVNILSPTRQNLAQHTSTPQNTTLFIPAGQVHGPAPTGAQNSSLFNNTALGSTPYIPVGGNLDQNLTTQILDLQNPTLLSVPSDNLVQQTQATQNISLQTLKVQQTTKPASPKQNPGLKTPTKRKVERLLFVVRSPTRPMPTVVQNPALLTGTAVQNPALLTGTAVQNPMQLTGTVVRNPMQLTGTAVQNPALLTGTAVQNPMQVTGTVVQNPKQLTGTAVQNPALLTGTAVQNPLQLTGTAVQNPTPLKGTIKQNPTPLKRTIKRNPTPLKRTMVHNPMQLTGTAVQNPALLTGTAVQNPTPLKGTIKRNPTPLKRTMVHNPMQLTGTAVQNPALLTGTVVQIPTRLTSSVTNPSLLNPPVQNSTQLLQTVPYPKCSQNPQSKIQTSLTPAAQNSVQPTPVIQNLTAKTLKTQSPVVQTPAKRNKSAKTPAIQKPTTQTLAPKTVKALATQNPTMMSLATHNPTVQILSAQNLPAQTPGMQNLAQNTQAAHIPAVPTATTKYPPPPQTPQTQNPTAQTTPVDNLAMDTVITLNLDIEMDYTEPDELQAPELILPSIVTPRPQHGRLPMSTSVETPFVASFTPVPPPPSPSPSLSATSVSPKCKLSPPPPSPSPSLSATSVSPKCKLSPPQPSKPQPNPPPQSQERNTKTTALPKVTLKHDLNSAPLVKPQMFSGFKVQQREAPSSSSRLGGSGGLQGFLTKQPLTTPSLPQAPLSAPQKPTPGKMAARPDSAPKGQAAALMKIKKDPDQVPVPEDVKTASLRLKMLKKLKAKKKELAKLDYMLRERGMVPAPQACSAPPSVMCGASADTSPASSQLLSPGTPSTPSTMSSDGADMLEMLAGGGGDAFGHLMSGSAPENPQNLYPTSAPLSAPSTAPAPDFLTIDDFLDDVIFDTNAPEKVVENTEFDTLDMFL